MERYGTRLPESVRPGFERLSPEEQTAAAQRDVAAFASSLREFSRDRAARARSNANDAVRISGLVDSLVDRVELLERAYADLRRAIERQ